MATAIFRHGDPVYQDYTAGNSAIAAGAVVALENTVGIAHLDIPASTLGALAVGGGIYDINCAANYNAGTKVYWNATAAAVTSNSNGTLPFGFTMEATVTNTVCEVMHQPF